MPKKKSSNEEPKKVKAKKSKISLEEADEEEMEEMISEDIEDDTDFEDTDILDLPLDIIEDELDSDEEIDGLSVIEVVEEVKEEAPVKKKNMFNHRLKYDSIFKGKKNDMATDEFNPDFLVQKQTTFDLVDFHSSEDNYRISQLEEIIYQFVIEKTTIDMTASRRKPGRSEFNKYIQMLTEYVDLSLYTHGDIFCIFSTYFSDNLFSMFRLLDKKWGAIVAKELKNVFNNKDFDGFEIV
jgi:hypothetical protein